MSKKTLLILAASLYQLEAIKTAKRLGYRVVTTDNTPANPGHALADKSYGVDTTDRDAVLDLARRECVDGVIAPCTDVALPTAAYVAEQLALPGAPLDSAHMVTSKVAFRDFLKKNSFPMPETYAVSANSRPDRRLFIGERWIVKPDRSSGSKGVCIIDSEQDFYQHLPETLRFSPTRVGVLEKFLEGFQGTCEGFLSGGRVVLSWVLDRQTAPAPYVTTCGHRVPSRLPATLQARLITYLETIWRMLCIENGPFDCDFVVSNDEVYILEMTPRLGGNSISSLVRLAAHCDIVELSVKHACGDLELIPKQPAVKPTAVVLLGVFKQGRLCYDASEMKALQNEPWVKSLVLDAKLGEPVVPFINSRHRVGEAIVYGKDRDELDARVLELKQRLGLKAV